MSKALNNNASSIDIFISHSSKDARIARALIELLRIALNIPAERIRCTSVNGYRPPAGASTEEHLRQEVHEATVFIGLITQESIQSVYVLFELGARWGASQHLIPLIASEVGASVLRGPLSSLNALRSDDAGQIHQLITDVGSKLGRSQVNPAAYQENIEKLIQLSSEQKDTQTSFTRKEGIKRQQVTDRISWKRWTIGIVLFVAAILVTLPMWKSNVDLPSVEITDPRDDSVVNTSEMITGKSQRIPEGKLIWIVIYSKARFLYIPQDGPANNQIGGSWSSHASIGSDEPEGSRFEIMAVLADKNAQEVFLSNREQEPGLKVLPDGAAIYSQIRVTTK